MNDLAPILYAVAAIITSLAALVGAVMGIVNRAAIKDVHAATNGLAQKFADASRAEGVEVGKAQEKARHK